MANPPVSKKFLNLFYRETYNKFANCLNDINVDGLVVELGSGGGFIKQFITNAITSDIIKEVDVDKYIDATKMDFPDNSVKAIFLFNVFHHIPSSDQFLSEAQRVLKPGGRVFMVEPHPGFPGTLVYKYLHHERFDKNAGDWSFPSKNPLLDANSALPWIVFKRDRKLFEKKFPDLKLTRYKTHSPFRYWISGGLKKWSLAPGTAFSLWTTIDNSLNSIHEDFASFVDIEIRKKEASADL